MDRIPTYSIGYNMIKGGNKPMQSITPTMAYTRVNTFKITGIIIDYSCKYLFLVKHKIIYCDSEQEVSTLKWF